MSVIDDRSDAEHAVEALMAAGVASDDISLVEGRQVLELERDFQDHHGLMGRIGAFFSFLTSDSGAYHQQYLDEAEMGHQILVVHAPEQEDVERARDILVAHHAHAARHYGKLAIVDLIL